MKMATPAILLDHLNIPARDPEGLARWYAETFGLTAKAHVARAPGVLLVFVRGEPVDPASEFHMGLHVPSINALKEWAKKFNAELTPGAEFTTFRTHDPEGNCIEVYANTEG
jgi:catechol-2,3-dioxygenase